MQKVLKNGYVPEPLLYASNREAPSFWSDDISNKFPGSTALLTLWIRALFCALHMRPALCRIVTLCTNKRCARCLENARHVF
jgi:hypothetical protein